MVCRDHEGTYLGSSVLAIRGLLDPTTVEAVACREALELADDPGIRKPFVASDAKSVVGFIHNGGGGNYEEIIKEIRDQANTFISCIFTHESRDSNVDAHRLARLGVSLNEGRHVWLGNPYHPMMIAVNILVEK